MAQPPIIRRTEKIREAASLLKERRIVYISAFFYSGKTVLLSQLCDAWDGPILWFRPEEEEWTCFRQRAAEAKGSLLVIDSIDHPAPEMEGRLTSLLAQTKDTHYIILAGRAQMPAELHSMCASGVIATLGREFMMFDAEEIVQLFLEYGLELLPSDVQMILSRLWGWAFGLHMLARRLLSHGSTSFSAAIEDTREDIKRILVTDVISSFPEAERQLMYNLSPFEHFSADMARIVTGRTDAPKVMDDISRRSYMFLRQGNSEYVFIPIVRQALFSEMRNLYTQDYINGQFRRAALYYELAGKVPQAIAYYRKLGDVEKIRELLIRDTFNRPADGDYVDLRDGYAMLDRETILAYPELIKGKCEIECLQGHAEESDRWYEALEQFIRRTPARDARRQTALEARAYLDLCLSHRGSGGTLKRLLAVAKSPALIQSPAWRNGFNVSGNSVSLLNGGLDFSRWVPHGWRIYRLFRRPIELALGKSGGGVAELAIAERDLEARLDGDYTEAMLKVREGLQRTADNPELHYAGIGIQSRMEAAQGNVQTAVSMMDHAISSLTEQSPRRLAQNLEVFRLHLLLLSGDTSEARSWLETKAPDETSDFVIMDRYRYMLKLRLYIILGQREKVPFLAALLRQYFESYDRPYMLIQLNLLEAVCHFRSGNDLWRTRMQEALSLARHYGLARVIADEGIAIIDLLNEMQLPEGAWEQGILSLTRRQAAFYPAFMKQAAIRPMFTDREYQVYSLMTAGYRNAKIASILGISERTVKYFCALIYKKLGVETRAEALNRAAELGDIT